MSAIIAKTTKQSQHPCGFCSTGHHDACPGGVLNGNLTEVVLCGCSAHELPTRCLNCGNRGEEVSPETWSCLDVEGCLQKVEKRREDVLRSLYGSTPSGEARKPHEVKGTRTTAPRAPKGGKCLCCGEATKGGKFLPGHDSRYLSDLQIRLNNQRATAAELIEAMEAEGCSPALVAKFRKRVGA